MSSMVKNAAAVTSGIDLWIGQVRNVSVAQYQDFVWEVFKRILRESPQYSGKAVANWRLGIGAPDETFDDSLGDEEAVEVVEDKSGRFRDAVTATREKGDEKWARVARDRARKVMLAIRYRDKVFISNNSLGDDGKLYMAELQDAAYWSQHLRAVNQPYETAKESIVAVALMMANRRNNPSLAPRIGGASWKEP